jgi:hypothetical protein
VVKEEQYEDDRRGIYIVETDLFQNENAYAHSHYILIHPIEDVVWLDEE